MKTVYEVIVGSVICYKDVLKGFMNTVLLSDFMFGILIGMLLGMWYFQWVTR